MMRRRPSAVTISGMDAEGLGNLIRDLSVLSQDRIQEMIHGPRIHVLHYRDDDTFSVMLYGDQADSLKDRLFENDLANRYRP